VNIEAGKEEPADSGLAVTEAQIEPCGD
jgi:hypothetical protein